MKTEITSAALLGISHIVTNAPYFILACALFWRQRRFAPLPTALSFAAFIFAHGLSDFILGSFYTGDVLWMPIQFITFVIGTLALLFVMFRVKFARVLYCFLLLRAVYTSVLYVVLNCFRFALPGQYIGFDKTPLYTLTAVLAIAAVFPFLWRYFTLHLRDAFSELDDITIRQLCVPPVMFFALDQFYSVIRDTLKYDNIQTAAVFLFMLLTGLATYYVNLRMIMDNARQSRIAMDAKIKEQALADENATLERFNRMRTELIATISHETKTPLAILSVYTELIAKELRRKDIDAQMAKDLDTVTEETQRISRLMDELQSHVREQDTQLLKTQLNIGVLIIGVVRLFTPIAERKNNALTIYIPKDLPDSYACAGEITQVFFNLVQNANNHTERGRIEITATSSSNTITITVSDTGTGIRSELLPHLFERGVTDSKEGSGLGLALCKEIIDHHGGGIEIKSELGKGTAVRFTLPVWKEGTIYGQQNNLVG